MNMLLRLKIWVSNCRNSRPLQQGKLKDALDAHDALKEEHKSLMDKAKQEHADAQQKWDDERNAAKTTVEQLEERCRHLQRQLEEQKQKTNEAETKGKELAQKEEETANLCKVNNTMHEEHIRVCAERWIRMDAEIQERQRTIEKLQQGIHRST